MKLALAADHAGFSLKEALKPFLESLGHEVKDFGAHEFNKDDDYPDFIIPAAQAVAQGDVDRAIVIGSSGQGEGAAANRVKGVRALVYYGHRDPLPKTSKTGEQKGLVASSREDNDSNVLALGASFATEDEARRVAEEWLTTEFPGEERHTRRIQKLDQ